MKMTTFDRTIQIIQTASPFVIIIVGFTCNVVLNSIKAEMNNIRSDIADVKSDVKTLDNRMTNIENRMVNIEKEVSYIKGANDARKN